MGTRSREVETVCRCAEEVEVTCVRLTVFSDSREIMIFFLYVNLLTRRSFLCPLAVTILNTTVRRFPKTCKARWSTIGMPLWSQLRVYRRGSSAAFGMNGSCVEMFYLERTIRRRPKRRESIENAPGPIRKRVVVTEREKTS